MQTRARGAVTGRDAQLAHRIADAVARLGLRPAGPTSSESAPPVHMLEIAIDALDIGAIRLFWKGSVQPKLGWRDAELIRNPSSILERSY